MGVNDNLYNAQFIDHAHQPRLQLRDGRRHPQPRGREPLLRRRAHLLRPHRRRRHHRGGRLRGPRLRHQPGLGRHDERPHGRQDPGGGPRALRALHVHGPRRGDGRGRSSRQLDEAPLLATSRTCPARVKCAGARLAHPRRDARTDEEDSHGFWHVLHQGTLRPAGDERPGQHEGWVSLGDVSERQHISRKYLEQVISLMHKAGYVESRARSARRSNPAPPSPSGATSGR